MPSETAVRFRFLDGLDLVGDFVVPDGSAQKTRRSRRSSGRAAVAINTKDYLHTSAQKVASLIVV